MEQPREELIRIGPLELRFYLDKAHTAGGMTVFEFTVPPRASVAMPHFHRDVDEFVYGLEGVLSFTIEGETRWIGPGDHCFIRRGATHHFVNEGACNARALSTMAPASIGAEFFRAMARLVGSGAPVDPELMRAVMLSHGLVPSVSNPPKGE
jgi:quercetin dioxygenase-like cupin family protein